MHYPFLCCREGKRGVSRSLVPSTGGAGRAVLWFLAQAVRAGSFCGSQHRGSVAWRKSAALLQAREEEEEDRGEKRRREEKRREILIGADQDQDLSRVFKQEVLSLVFSRWRC